MHIAHREFTKLIIIIIGYWCLMHCMSIEFGNDFSTEFIVEAMKLLNEHEQSFLNDFIERLIELKIKMLLVKLN